MSKISVFSIVKNEAAFIGVGVMSLLPYVDEIVYADGNSTDGTLEILDYIKKKYDTSDKIKVLKNMDCSDLKDDYVRLFNETMKQCNADYLLYCHPDMILTDPGVLADSRLGDNNEFAYYVNIRSFAGEKIEKEIVKGRTNKWKTIMKNDFGLHYWGHYGHNDEDMYFRDITGDEYVVHKDMSRYPFEVHDSGIKLWHLCECKSLARREQKMENVARTVMGMTNHVHINDLLANHPRVTLRSDKNMFGEFQFVERTEELPEAFKYQKEFEGVIR